MSFVALSGDEDSEKIAELEEYAEPVEDSVLGAGCGGGAGVGECCAGGGQCVHVV